MAAAWLSVIMDELRSPCAPCGARSDSPISAVCRVQACSQTSSYRCTPAHTRARVHVHQLNSLVYFIPLIARLPYLVPPISCSASPAAATLMFLVLFINPAPPHQHRPHPVTTHSPLSFTLGHVFYPVSFVLFRGGGVFLGSQEEKPFHKNINANLISARPPPTPPAEGAKRIGGVGGRWRRRWWGNQLI